MFSQFSCPTSRPRKLRFCFESIQSPFPISSDFDGGRRRGGVEFSLAFQLNIRFFMAPFPAFNTLMTVLIHISSSSNFSFLHTAHLFYMYSPLGPWLKSSGLIFLHFQITLTSAKNKSHIIHGYCRRIAQWCYYGHFGKWFCISYLNKRRQ